MAYRELWHEKSAQGKQKLSRFAVVVEVERDGGIYAAKACVKSGTRMLPSLSYRRNARGEHIGRRAPTRQCGFTPGATNSPTKAAKGALEDLAYRLGRRS